MNISLRCLQGNSFLKTPNYKVLHLKLHTFLQNILNGINLQQAKTDYFIQNKENELLDSLEI